MYIVYFILWVLLAVVIASTKCIETWRVFVLNALFIAILIVYKYGI